MYLVELNYFAKIDEDEQFMLNKSVHYLKSKTKNPEEEQHLMKLSQIPLELELEDFKVDDIDF